MKQLTKEQAIALHDSRVWEKWTVEEIVRFQLYQNKLCVPFSIFHTAIEKVLCRPVWTHEFAFRDELIAEYERQKPAPTFEEIFSLLPTDKTIILVSERQVNDEMQCM